MLNDKDFLILTGSDSTHFNSLVNLLKTLIAYEPNTEVVIINLGMSKNEIQYLESNFNYQIKELNLKNILVLLVEETILINWVPMLGNLYQYTMNLMKQKKCNFIRCRLPNN